MQMGGEESPRKHTETDIKHQPVKGYFWLPNVKHRPDPLCFFDNLDDSVMKNMFLLPCCRHTW